MSPSPFQPGAQSRRRSFRTIAGLRRIAVAGLASTLLWGAALPTVAHVPGEMGMVASGVGPTHGATAAGQIRAPSPTRTPPSLQALTSGSIGHDISFPQCNKGFPQNAAFRIVGVNGGRAFSANPCLGTGEGPSQLRWAGRWASFYANTGSPGPRLSKRWPIGQRYPRRCTRDEPLGKGCAFDYGWNAAKDSYLTAVRAYISLGWASPGATRTPVHNRWWLDVETSNSWRRNKRLNVATLQGAVAFLRSRDVGFIGFYSARHMWEAITGNTLVFADHPSWVAGASTLRGAKRLCREPAFTGGRTRLSQFFRHGFDADVAC
ncbi:MAG TPA: hypothetical protein VIA82_02955 [Candidatus Limnocylindria bacterium]